MALSCKVKNFKKNGRNGKLLQYDQENDPGEILTERFIPPLIEKSHLKIFAKDIY